MKLSKIEKVIGTSLVALLILFSTSLYLGIKEFNKAGGFKALAVEIGKDMKDISSEIDKHQTK